MMKKNIIYDKKSDTKIFLKCKIKAQKQKNYHYSNQNDPNNANRQLSQQPKQYMIDLNKKIKKLHKKPKYVSISNITSHQDTLSHIHGVVCYPDQQIGLNVEERSLIVPQRLDNDIDTDDDQVQSGVKKLYRALIEALGHQQIKQ